MPPKAYRVKLKLSSEFLSTLPKDISTAKPVKERKKPGPVPKAAKLAKANNSLASSPVPESPSLTPFGGSKYLPKSQLGANTLDRSGRKAIPWVMAEKELKTFSGYKLLFRTWKSKEMAEKSRQRALEIKAEEELAKNISETPLLKPEDDMEDSVTIGTSVVGTPLNLNEDAGLADIGSPISLNIHTEVSSPAAG